MVRNHYLETHHYADLVLNTRFFVILLLRSQHKTVTMKQHQQKFTLALRAMRLRPLRLDQDKEYIFSIQWCV